MAHLSADIKRQTGGHTIDTPSILISAKILLRGIAQIIFQEKSLTGLLFILGVLVSSPLMALGLIAGSAIGSAVAHGLKFDSKELQSGIYGFNSALVGIATLFFFQPGVITAGLLIVGCSLSAVLTFLCRRHIPFPTYTSPFIVTTWILFLIGPSLGTVAVEANGTPFISAPASGIQLESVTHGVGQILFQANLLTGIFFLTAVFISNRTHALLLIMGAIVGGAVAGYHIDTAYRTLDPERLIMRDQFENIRLGLYGYNAALAGVALYLWRRSIILPLLGMMLTVPLTEMIPHWGIPALTAPFVLATWLVLFIAWLESKAIPHPDAKL